MGRYKSFLLIACSLTSSAFVGYFLASYLGRGSLVAEVGSVASTGSTAPTADVTPVKTDSKRDTKIEDRLAAETYEATSVIATTATDPELANRKVRTVTVRPDGTIVSGDDALAGNEALPIDRPNGPQVSHTVIAALEPITGTVSFAPEMTSDTRLSTYLARELLLAKAEGRPLDPELARRSPLGVHALQDPAFAEYLWRLAASDAKLISPAVPVRTLDQRLAELSVPVKVGIEVDQSMEEGRVYEATVLIQSNPAAGAVDVLETFRELQAATPEPTADEDDTSVVPDEVRATLVGAAFQIEELKGGWQSIVEGVPSVWKWKITPSASGAVGLLFSVEQRLHSDSGTPLVLPAENYPKTIEVAVSPTKAWRQAWEWLRDNAGTLIVVLAAALAGIVSYFQIVAYVLRKPRTATRSKGDQRPMTETTSRPRTARRKAASVRLPAQD